MHSNVGMCTVHMSDLQSNLEKSVDLDQLASMKPADLDLLFLGPHNP